MKLIFFVFRRKILSAVAILSVFQGSKVANYLSSNITRRKLCKHYQSEIWNPSGECSCVLSKVHLLRWGPFTGLGRVEYEEWCHGQCKRYLGSQDGWPKGSFSGPECPQFKAQSLCQTSVLYMVTNKQISLGWLSSGNL